tara:strand:- start:468 stop:881 length:414 start_codon:yes stop_codon:yes gene_type:complete
MPILTIEQIRLAETEKGNIVTLFACDTKTNEGICGVFNLSERKFELGKKDLKNLKILNIKEMNSILTDEKDPTGNYRLAVGYLMEIGIDDNIWDNSWGTFQWNTVEKSSEKKYSVIVKNGNLTSPPTKRIKTEESTI